MNTKKLQRRMEAAAVQLQASTPDTILALANAKQRFHRLIETENENALTIENALRTWIDTESWPDLLPQQQFLVWGRLMSGAELITQMHAVGLELTLSAILQFSASMFSELLLISSWRFRRESWWSQFVARLEIDEA